MPNEAQDPAHEADRTSSELVIDVAPADGGGYDVRRAGAGPREAARFPTLEAARAHALAYAQRSPPSVVRVQGPSGLAETRYRVDGGMSTSVRSARGSRPSRRGHALVLSGDPALAELLRSCISAAGVRCAVAADCDEAESAFAVLRPSLLLIDLDPRDYTAQTLKTLRRAGLLQQPTLVLSPYATTEGPGTSLGAADVTFAPWSLAIATRFAKERA